MPVDIIKIIHLKYFTYNDICLRIKKVKTRKIFSDILE